MNKIIDCDNINVDRFEKKCMYEKQSKNTLILNILQILERYSDKNHRLNQQQIIDYLKSDYGMEVERKSIARNIDNLIEADYDIEYEENERGKGKNKNVVRTNFYIERKFDDSELRFLIDGLIFSKLVSQNQKKQLIKRLESLSSKYFKSSMNKIETAKNDGLKNEDLFLNIEILAEAIEKGKKVKLNYCHYDLNKKLVINTDKEGNIEEYIINPYQMVAANAKYYLVCTTSKYPGVTNLRLDRMKNVTILDENVELDGTLKDYDIPKHMVEHIYMMIGESENVTFRFNRRIFNDVIDWFGDGIIIKKTNKDVELEATVKVNLNAMKFWALQYAENVTVKAPKKLVVDIKKVINEMNKRYK